MIELEIGKLFLVVFSVRIVLIVLAVFSVLKSFFLIRLLSNDENLNIRISEHKIIVAKQLAIRYYYYIDSDSTSPQSTPEG